MVLAALTLRLIVMAFTLPLQLAPERDHFAFGFEMGRVARSIATGQGFSSPYPEPTGPTALVAPAYPYLLAAIFKIFGVYTTSSAIAGLALNNFFSAVTCWPIFLIGQKVFGPRVALWSGWAWAFFPYAIGLSNRWIWDTSITTCLFALLILATWNLQKSCRPLAWLGYGLLWGGAALLNPSVLSTLPFLFLWLWVRHQRSGRRCTGAMTASAVICLACLSIWLVRDFRTFGKFIPLRSGFALEFQLGNSDDTSRPDSDHLLPPDNPAEMEKFRQLGENAYMAEKQQEVKDFLRQHPGRFFWLTLRRIFFLWTGLWGAHPSWSLDDELGVPNILAYSVLSSLAFLGLYRSFQNRVPFAVPLAVILLAFPLVYYVTHPDVRYRHPIDPAIVLLAVYGARNIRAASTYKSRYRAAQ